MGNEDGLTSALASQGTNMVESKEELIELIKAFLTGALIGFILL